jgi:hypothetical protein
VLDGLGRPAKHGAAVVGDEDRDASRPGPCPTTPTTVIVKVRR